MFRVLLFLVALISGIVMEMIPEGSGHVFLVAVCAIASLAFVVAMVMTEWTSTPPREYVARPRRKKI